MNERMYELINQCFIGTTDGKMSELNTVANVEKFAELIVRECGEYLMRPEFIGRSDLDWSMVLNEHFGVKE